MKKNSLKHFLKILNERELPQLLIHLQKKAKTSAQLALGADILCFDMIFREFGIEEEDLLEIAGKVYKKLLKIEFFIDLMETDEQISMLLKRIEQTKKMIVENIEIVYGH